MHEAGERRGGELWEGRGGGEGGEGGGGGGGGGGRAEGGMARDRWS